ncbi:hypothetical protein Tco_1038471, partial [Tanacetum coccineum]
TELLMERISKLHKKVLIVCMVNDSPIDFCYSVNLESADHERKLANETEEMKQQVASAKPRNNDEEVDGGGGGLTLPLF